MQQYTLFFLAMTLFPDVQKRAQAEIDAVVGQDRLPSYADRDHLPFVEVLVQEVLRFLSVVPIGKNSTHLSYPWSRVHSNIAL